MLGVNYDKAAVRRTRQELADRVRNDWEDVLEQRHHADADGAQINPDLFVLPPTDVVEWRERTYASSDPSDHEDTEDEEEPTSSLSQPAKRAPTNNSSKANGKRTFFNHHSIYPDGQDTDADSGTDSSSRVSTNETRRRQERKRRRRRRLDEEMTWNQGLRHWEETRDIWCRAKKVPTSALVSASSPETTNTSAATSVDQEERTDKDQQSLEETETQHNLGRAVSNMHITPYPTSDSTDTTSRPQRRHQQQNTTLTLLPVPPPLIPPTDPGRQNLQKQTSLIYNKVVLESLRPTVPINLANMLPILVSGWKANDEWPPKSSVGSGANGGGGAGSDAMAKGAKLEGMRRKAANTGGKSQLKGEWWTQRQRKLPKQKEKEGGGKLAGLKEGSKKLFGMGDADAQKEKEKLVANTIPWSNARKSLDRTSIKGRKSTESKSSSRKSVEVTKSPKADSQEADSVRGSSEFESGKEKDKDKQSSLEMRKSAAKIGRKLRNSIDGGSTVVAAKE